MDRKKGQNTDLDCIDLSQLIFSIIHRQIKETEPFVTLVNVIYNTMNYYMCLNKIHEKGGQKPQERNPEIRQLQLFDVDWKGSFNGSTKNSTDSS
ncbi:MAG: hypothetical protein AAF600_18720 [Bacteroidota bacterium]